MNPIRTALVAVVVVASPTAAQEWWSSYHVGDQVMFSISGNASDFQPCVVEEASENAGLRVRCKAFRQWPADRYIVYGKSYIRPAGAKASIPAAVPVAARPTVPQPAPVRAGGALKPGEYACYGSGGRILAGLGFKLAPDGSYTDLEGGNRGRISVGNGEVRFTGGHLGGRIARRLAGNSFAFGQTECEPY